MKCVFIREFKKTCLNSFDKYLFSSACLLSICLEDMLVTKRLYSTCVFIVYYLTYTLQKFFFCYHFAIALVFGSLFKTVAALITPGHLNVRYHCVYLYGCHCPTTIFANTDPAFIFLKLLAYIHSMYVLVSHRRRGSSLNSARNRLSGCRLFLFLCPVLQPR